jgi:hypothetical protein
VTEDTHVSLVSGRDCQQLSVELCGSLRVIPATPDVQHRRGRRSSSWMEDLEASLLPSPLTEKVFIGC